MSIQSKLGELSQGGRVRLYQRRLARMKALCSQGDGSISLHTLMRYEQELKVIWRWMNPFTQICADPKIIVPLVRRGYAVVRQVRQEDMGDRVWLELFLRYRGHTRTIDFETPWETFDSMPAKDYDFARILLGFGNRPQKTGTEDA